MAIFGKIKTMFGLSDSEFEEEINREDYARDATVTPLSQRRHADTPDPVAAPEAEPLAQPEPQPAGIGAVPDAIFEKVIEVFNQALPSFLRETVDPEAQRRYLYDALDQSMKEYLASLEVSAEEKLNRKWAADRSRLNREMEDIRQKSRQIEDSSAEWREQKLSAERQKRALSERVHDLEKQVDALQAEKEQYDLENKSLVNKVRVMSTREGDSEALREEADNLRAEVNRLKAELVAAREEAENAAAAATQTAPATPAEEAPTTDSAEIEELNEKLRIAAGQIEARDEEIQTVRDELDEARRVLNQFEETLSQFEGIKAGKDKRIGQLQDDVKERDTKIVDLEKKFSDACEEVKSLKSTIENNIRLQAESEEVLRKEIERLRKEEAAEPRRGRKPSKPASIEDTLDDLDDTNWLVGTPPEGTNARPVGISDEEFGYQEPKRKPTHDDPAQMSLW